MSSAVRSAANKPELTKLETDSIKKRKHSLTSSFCDRFQPLSTWPRHKTNHNIAVLQSVLAPLEDMSFCWTMSQIWFIYFLLDSFALLLIIIWYGNNFSDSHGITTEVMVASEAVATAWHLLLHNFVGTVCSVQYWQSTSGTQQDSFSFILFKLF